MRVILCTVCEQAILDKDDTISLINIMSDIGAAGFPILIPKVTVAAIMERSPDDPVVADTRLRVKLSDQELFVMPWESDFQGRRRLQALALIQGFIITGIGTLRFSVMLGEQQELGFWEIAVTSLGPQTDLFSAPPTPTVAEPIPGV